MTPRFAWTPPPKTSSDGFLSGYSPRASAIPFIAANGTTAVPNGLSAPYPPSSSNTRTQRHCISVEHTSSTNVSFHVGLRLLFTVFVLVASRSFPATFFRDPSDTVAYGSLFPRKSAFRNPRARTIVTRSCPTGVISSASSMARTVAGVCRLATTTPAARGNTSRSRVALVTAASIAALSPGIELTDRRGIPGAALTLMR